VKIFDADRTRMIGLSYGVIPITVCCRFHPIPEPYGQTDNVRQTDGRTDGQNCYINFACQYANARFKSAIFALQCISATMFNHCNMHIETDMYMFDSM